MSSACNPCAQTQNQFSLRLGLLTFGGALRRKKAKLYQQSIQPGWPFPCTI